MTITCKLKYLQIDKIIIQFLFHSGILVTILFLRTEEKKIEKREQNKQDVNKNINGYSNSALSISVISQQSFKEDVFDSPKSIYSRAELLGMIKNFFILLSYRVVRLTPAYAFVIGTPNFTTVL